MTAQRPPVNGTLSDQSVLLLQLKGRMIDGVGKQAMFSPQSG